jgi:hypothetical protein
VEIKETVEAMGFTQDQLRQASLAGLPFGTVDTVLKNLTVFLKTLAAPEGNIALFQKVAGAPPSFGRTDSSAFRWLLAWLDLEGAVPAPLLMTYEWLSASPLVEARRICHWLGLNVTADQLMVVMQQSTAAAMKSKLGKVNTGVRGTKHAAVRQGISCSFDSELLNDTLVEMNLLMLHHASQPLRLLYGPMHHQKHDSSEVASCSRLPTGGWVALRRDEWRERAKSWILGNTPQKASNSEPKSGDVAENDQPMEQQSPELAFNPISQRVQMSPTS